MRITPESSFGIASSDQGGFLAEKDRGRLVEIEREGHTNYLITKIKKTVENSKLGDNRRAKSTLISRTAVPRGRWTARTPRGIMRFANPQNISDFVYFFEFQVGDT